MKLFDLTGRKAIVTGGTRGLGYGMAEGLMEAGAEVMIVGSTDKAKEVAADFAAKGFACQGIKIDLGNREEVKTGFAQAVEMPITVEAPMIDVFNKILSFSKGISICTAII